MCMLLLENNKDIQWKIAAMCKNLEKKNIIIFAREKKKKEKKMNKKMTQKERKRDKDKYL